MPKLVNLIAICSCIATLIFATIYLKTANAVCFSLAITCGTTAYHFVMRLAVGLVLNQAMHNRADYNRRWFQPKSFEEKIYQKLHVKSWKGRMPTYRPEIFSTKAHSLEDIAQAMCQSEIVHEIIVVLSFVPLAASVWFGSFAVFLITSVLAAGFDMIFVIMQRYNRPRILKVIQKRQSKFEKAVQK
ncbi:MAG: hypothetical protein Q4P20_01545 [Eubacteriales bacterium]|nr:hypothetical protein [Eubacteriales bacterium]